MKKLLELIKKEGWHVDVDNNAASSFIVYGTKDRTDWDARYAFSRSNEFIAALRKVGLRAVNQVTWLRVNQVSGLTFSADEITLIAKCAASDGFVPSVLTDFSERAETLLADLDQLIGQVAEFNVQGDDEEISATAVGNLVMAQRHLREFVTALED